ncbi:MAG TPA: EAL domain-containing protein [Acetobacteraceae bacterium]|nr:EAL domain-containing protein [Acetobacteraceae bacterium]
MIIDRGLLLEHVAHLAADVTGTSFAMIQVVSERKELGARRAAVGLSAPQVNALPQLDNLTNPVQELTVIPDVTADARFASLAPAFAGSRFRKLIYRRLVSSGDERLGFICLVDDVSRADPTAAQIESLNHVGSIIVSDRQREQRHLHLVHVADRALRIEQMLHLVSEAETCADALSRVLEALCRFHGATIGQIHQLIRPDTPLFEISRYDDTARGETERESGETLAALDTLAMEAIRRNKPFVTHRSQIEPPHVAADLAVLKVLCHVSVPVWVHQQRFGISLAFATDKSELDLVAADIMSLGDAVRPVLLQKVTEERMRFAAYHDDLTRLPNRLMFLERLGTAIATARSSAQSFAVLCLDLDGFKLANDTFGHGFGDNLLVCVAQRLREVAAGSNTVARTGGDEFAVIQVGNDLPSEATDLAEQILAAISQPFELAGQSVTIGVSIGIALYPQHGESPDLLLRSADQALYFAKRAGRNTCHVCDPELQAAERASSQIERYLKEAIDGGTLTLAYQPIFDVELSSVVGFEALLRWHHPVLGDVAPDKFIPIAEQSGLIVPLGRWVLETACADAAAWEQPVTVSVNLSPLQFRQADLPRQIADVLSRTGLPAERLKLEVTEGLLLDESELVLRTMRELHAQGIRVVLDDFGTAYAGINYLRRYPFHGIKIDKSFVRDLDEDKATLAIVEATLSLADRLSLAVVAEGVETERELDVLRRLGCRLIQGYLVGRPMTDRQVRLLSRCPRAEHAILDPITARRQLPADQPRVAPVTTANPLADVLGTAPYRASEQQGAIRRDRRNELRPTRVHAAAEKSAYSQSVGLMD